MALQPQFMDPLPGPGFRCIAAAPLRSGPACLAHSRPAESLLAPFQNTFKQRIDIAEYSFKFTQNALGNWA